MLFSSKRGCRPGPKGPGKELIDAVVGIKRRNPAWGCPRIAQQITLAFGVEIDKDVVRILHRRNSLFYKTRKGAEMGDLFMSLIHTCELNGVNPFDYLTELQRHAEELKQKPSEWMPWNYRETLARLAIPTAT